jgi:hypothetical protein
MPSGEIATELMYSTLTMGFVPVSVIPESVRYLSNSFLAHNEGRYLLSMLLLPLGVKHLQTRT